MLELFGHLSMGYAIIMSAYAMFAKMSESDRHGMLITAAIIFLFGLILTNYSV